MQVGDYILSPEICCERKSIPDLRQSLASGRLYHQARRGGRPAGWGLGAWVAAGGGEGVAVRHAAPSHLADASPALALAPTGIQPNQAPAAPQNPTPPQAEAMARHYKTPVLLIEFEGDKAFALQVRCDDGWLV